MSNSTGAQVHHHAHHFESEEAEFSAAKQGMWIFLVTEVLMLGGLFVAYGILRGLYPDVFHEAHKQLNVTLGGTNTLVLITSSVTMVLGVVTAQKGQPKASFRWLLATFVLACCFLVVKYFEYSAKFHHGLLPGGYFADHHLIEEATKAGVVNAAKIPLFFSLYFIMTGIHGLHVIIGMGLIAWVMKRTRNGEFSTSYYTPVELVGFYWHFVDLVWIYLFPLLYLIT